MLPVEQILDYPVTPAGADRCAAEIGAWIDAGGALRYAVCLNPHSVVVADADPGFRQALVGADMIIPDGAGIVLASRVLGGGIRERVTGADLFRAVNAALDQRGGSCFFLGAAESTLALIVTRMAADFPRVRIAGVHSPPFRAEFTAEDDARMREAVNAARPDVLWVGLTAPKQEKWIHRNRALLDARFAGAIGAVFDFYSGVVRRPAPAVQRVGLEWLPRFLREPRRLWRRNLVSTPLFLWKLARRRVSGPTG